MFKTQKILIGDGKISDEQAADLMSVNNCVAYFKSIPSYLIQRALAEKWNLPYVYTESWEEPDQII
jgi:hypothetical protein